MTDTVAALIGEIESWNAGDKEAFNSFGMVPIDGSFVFVAREKVIQKLKKELDSNPNIS